MKSFSIPKVEGKFLLWSVIFFVISVFLHWRLNPNLVIILYAIGALIGIFLLEFMEIIVNINPSPLRGVLAQLIILILTIFALTSTGNFVGKGVILFLNLKYLYLSRQEFLNSGNLTNWFRQVNININPQRSEMYLLLFTMVIIFETVIFMLV